MERDYFQGVVRPAKVERDDMGALFDFSSARDRQKKTLVGPQSESVGRVLPVLLEVPALVV